MATTDASKLHDAHVFDQVVLKPDISLEESQAYYRKLAELETYNKIHCPKGYAALQELGKTVTGLWDDRNALILDVGAGTGLSGLRLQEAGYYNIHALEPLPEFAQTIQNTYKKVIQEFIGVEGKPLDIPDNTYDGVVSTGAFGPGCIPVEAVAEMLRITKPGGYVVILMREEFLWTVPAYKDKLEPTMQQMEQEGKWKLVEREIYPNHFVGKNGVMFKYQVC